TLPVPTAPTEGTAPATAETAVAAPPAESPPSPDVSAVNSDLHWLIHQGHVIEFANAIIELARRPIPKPPRPEPKPVEPKTAEAPKSALPETKVKADPGDTPQVPASDDGQVVAEGPVAAG